jgi:hypothetical protein
MKKITLYFFFMLAGVSFLNAQQVVAKKEIQNTTHFFLEKEKIIPANDGSVYYTCFARLGYCVEKYDAELRLKKSVLRKFNDENIENEFVYPVIMQNDIYMVIGSYDKKTKECVLDLVHLNGSTLQPAETKNLLRAPGRLGFPNDETATRAVVSQSENGNYWSLVVFIGKDYTEKARFIVALFDGDGNIVNNKTFDTDYVNYAFMKPETKTGDDGNVYILSRIVFEHIQTEDQEHRHIFCISEKGSHLAVFAPRNYYQWAAGMEPAANGNLVAYMVTSFGMRTYLINGLTGELIKDHEIKIPVAELKDQAWWGDTQVLTVRRFFYPRFVKQGVNGDIYMVGEQSFDNVNPHYSTLIVKYNPQLEMEWSQIVPRYQKGYWAASVQPFMASEGLNILMNYNPVYFDMDLFSDGEFNSKEFTEKTKGMKYDEILRTDVYVADFDNSDETEWVELDDNLCNLPNGGNLKPEEQSLFLPGSAIVKGNKLYYLSGGLYDGDKSYFDCRRDIAMVEL